MHRFLSLLATGLILVPFQASAFDELQDCESCPLMVRVESGSYPRAGNIDGTPVNVNIEYDYALSRCEVTVGEFAEFAEATGLQPRGCQLFRTTGDIDYEEGGWSNPGFSQRDSRPVVCVSWDDARAYTQWLSELTGKAYRLPSESEWEFAARAGAGHDAMWFVRGNLKTGEAKCATCYGSDVMGREDELTTANVGGPNRNSFGLADMLGNVSEWTLDCGNAELASAPADGSARLDGICDRRVTRGGAFHSEWAGLSRFRVSRIAGLGRNDLGFRVLRELDNAGVDPAFEQYNSSDYGSDCK